MLIFKIPADRYGAQMCTAVSAQYEACTLSSKVAVQNDTQPN